MPHDPEDVIDFAMREHAKLIEENVHLRALLADVLATVVEAVQTLQEALTRTIIRTK